MPDKRSKDDPFANAEKSFAKALGTWTDVSVHALQAQGANDVAQTAAAFKNFLFRLLRSFFARLKQVIAQLDPFGAAQAIGSFVEAGIDDMLDDFNKLLDDLAAVPGAVADAAIGALLGIVEAIKKAFHLILDGIKLPHLTQPVELFLDLIDNILGNIAEMVSGVAGKSAKTFRNNMYGQLAMIRAADAARAGVVIPEDRRDDL
ncbi:hypothetical protein AB3Y40_10190 [Yoonia sp. R2331]|uniref:hypothetical protein n=1 Tax=Yoonia sp. R2331 TaxID=3237238 RepID=UPI0034E3C318